MMFEIKRNTRELVHDLMTRSSFDRRYLDPEFFINGQEVNPERFASIYQQFHQLYDPRLQLESDELSRRLMMKITTYQIVIGQEHNAL